MQSGLVRHILASNATELQEDILNTTGRLINAKYKQLLAYSLCLRDFRLQHRWMGEAGPQGDWGGGTWSCWPPDTLVILVGAHVRGSPPDPAGSTCAPIASGDPSAPWTGPRDGPPPALLLMLLAGRRQRGPGSALLVRHRAWFIPFKAHVRSPSHHTIPAPLHPA